MRAKQLIEKLNDLAAYFTLAASDAGKEQKKEAFIGSDRVATFYEGKKVGFETAFKKVDGIIKEAKRG